MEKMINVIKKIEKCATAYNKFIDVTDNFCSLFLEADVDIEIENNNVFWHELVEKDEYCYGDIIDKFSSKENIALNISAVVHELYREMRDDKSVLAKNAKSVFCIKRNGVYWAVSIEPCRESYSDKRGVILDVHEIESLFFMRKGSRLFSKNPIL